MSDGCFSCSGRCCYNIIVRVTPLDMWRIASSQQLAFAEFVEPWKEVEPSDFGLRLDDTADRYLPVLRRHPSEHAACTFLMHVADDVKRCGIYEHRPLVCQVYPFEMHTGTVRVRDDARCQPTDWNMATLDYRLRRDTVTRYRGELEHAARIAADWNRRPLTPSRDDAFRGYLELAREAGSDFFTREGSLETT